MPRGAVITRLSIFATPQVAGISQAAKTKTDSKNAKKKKRLLLDLQHFHVIPDRFNVIGRHRWHTFHNPIH